MSDQPASRPRPADPESTLDAGFRLVVVLVVVCLALAAIVVVRGSGGGSEAGAGVPGAVAGSASPSASAVPVDTASFVYPTPHPAAALSLEDQDGTAVTLASMRGGLVLVFFGYTHCPDVCPATIGTVGTAMAAYGPGVRSVFVTIDPERDTPDWLKEYDAYIPAGFTTLTGSADEIKATADAWDVKYARVDTGDPTAYSMSHTADVFIVDGDGMLRGHFPFGTSSDAMVATLRAVVAAGPVSSPTESPGASTAASATPAVPSPTAPAEPAPGSLQVQVTSSAVWAGPQSPVILDLNGPAGRLADTTIHPTVQLETTDGAPVGTPVEATPVQPPGLDTVSYVATVSIPTPGWWRIAVSTTPGALPLSGSTDVAVLDPGTTATIGSPAPPIHSPNLADVGGDVRQLSTDPLPDLRLYRTSTTDALANHQPFVLVLDSTKFRVTSACGKAVVLARYLQDRWPDVAFIHHEPYQYTVVTDTPVLTGSLGDPSLTDVASAWGIGGSPWGALTMPWVFIVDGSGVIRAKYQGVMGSDDVDVILSLIAQGG
jgi:protein SCO1/2